MDVVRKITDAIFAGIEVIKAHLIFKNLCHTERRSPFYLIYYKATPWDDKNILPQPESLSEFLFFFFDFGLHELLEDLNLLWLWCSIVFKTSSNIIAFLLSFKVEYELIK